MEAITPMTAEAFVAAGASPQEAANLAEQHETMAGRRSPDDRIALSMQMRDLPPPPKPAAPPPPSTSPAEAKAALEAHTESQFEAHLKEVYSPPASANDYKFPSAPENATEEQHAGDIALKQAFHAAALPKIAVDSIMANIASDSRALAKETPEQISARFDYTTERLSKMWGDQFDANVKTVGAFLDEMRQVPVLRDAINANSTALAINPLTWDMLLNVAKFRAKR
jgi:hypothetical protein